MQKGERESSAEVIEFQCDTIINELCTNKEPPHKSAIEKRKKRGSNKSQNLVFAIQEAMSLSYYPLQDNISKEELKALLEVTEQELFLTGNELKKLTEQLTLCQKETANLKVRQNSLEEFFQELKILLELTKKAFLTNNQHLARKERRKMESTVTSQAEEGVSTKSFL